MPARQKTKTTATPRFNQASLETSEFLTELIHRAGHEIGNPLTSIISLGTIIERFSDQGLELQPEKIGTYAKSIISEAWRVSAIVEKLVLLLSHRHVAPSSCDAAPAIERIINKLKSRGGVTTERIQLTVKGGIVPKLSVDPDQLTILLTELLSNALNATSTLQRTADTPQDFDRVQVSIEQSGAKTEISIVNRLLEPLNIPIETLFDPFITGHQHQKRLGIGLTTAAIIVERFNGTISLHETEEDGEDRFEVRVSLPAPEAAQSIEEDTVKSPGSASSELSHHRILIIEDEPTVSSAMSKILSVAFNARGGVSCTCVDGDEALRLLESKEPFDAILCDLHLENMSGRYIFEQLSSKDRASLKKFAFLTGEQIRPETRLYLKSSRRPYLLKPFEPEELVKLVESLLTS